MALTALIWMAACSLCSEPTQAEMLAQAQSLIETREYERAESLLMPLLAGEARARHLAQFGLANIEVLQASTSNPVNRSLLLKAIKGYRASIDHESDPTLIRNARHNILVAKTLLGQRYRTGGSNEDRLVPSKGDASTSRESETPATQADVGQGTESPLPRTAESKRVENIKRETPAIEDQDPGKLSPEQVRELIRQVESRRTRNASEGQPPIGRRLGPRDR